MKNTTFRKKALLSSVCMLLVALVALGSATFAWFTQNPTVTAEGLSLKATAAAGLQILSSSEAKHDVFSTSTTLNAIKKDTTDPSGVKLETPVSLDYSVTNSVAYNSAIAAEETAHTMKAGTISTGAAPSYTETLYLRSSIADSESAVVVKSAKVSFTKATAENIADAATLGNLYNAIRVTLIDGNTVIGTWSPDGVDNKYLTSTAVSTVDADFKNSGEEVTMNKTVKFVTDDDYDKADFVTLHVWLDGEDDACYTKNVENLKNLAKSITVQFSTVAPAAGE